MVQRGVRGFGAVWLLVFLTTARVFAADGELDLSFDPGTGANGPVVSVAVHETTGDVIIGGLFTAVNGIARPGVARLKSTGALDLSFAPQLTFPAEGGVFAVAVQPGGTVIVGGYLKTVPQGTPPTSSHHAVVRFTTTGAVDATWPNLFPAASAVTSLVVRPDGRVVAAGLFSLGNANVGYTEGIVQFSVDGGLDPAFEQRRQYARGANGDFDGRSPVTLALAENGDVWFGGDFNFYPGGRMGVGLLLANGQPGERYSEASVLPINSTWLITRVRPTPDGGLVIAGDFETVGGHLAQAVARLDARGMLDTRFSPSLGFGTPRIAGVPVPGLFADALAIQPDEKVVVSGSFTSVDGVRSPHIARLHTDGSRDATFTVGEGFDSEVTDLWLLPNGSFYAVGDFTRYNGVARNGVARLKGSSVPVAPTIVQQPLDVVVPLGGDARFTVQAAGTRPLRYQWFKDGVAIPGATSATLFVGMPSVDGAASFSVEVSNRVGSVMSASARLDLELRVDAYPTNHTTTALAGTTWVATGRAYGKPPYTYSWWKGDAELPGQTSRDLVLWNLRPEDAGRYTLVVRDALTTKVVEPWDLEVHDSGDFMLDRRYRPAPSVAASNLNEFQALANGDLLIVHLGGAMRVAPTGVVQAVYAGGISSATNHPWLAWEDGTLLARAGGSGAFTRYRPDGTKDGSFNLTATLPDEVEWFAPGSDGSVMAFGSSRAVLIEANGSASSRTLDARLTYVYGGAPRPGGGALVVVQIRTPGTMGRFELLRVRPDWTVDDAFVVSLGENWPPPRIVPLHDGGALVAEGWGSVPWRLRADGSRDSDFPTDLPQGLPTKIFPDDTFYLWLKEAATDTYFAVLHDRSGHVVADAPRLKLGVGGTLTNVVVPAPDGAMWIAGNYGSLQGTPSSRLMRLVPAATAAVGRLVNLSTRGLAGNGARQLIAGYVLAGEGQSRPLLFRAVGPGLRSGGVQNVVEDPLLQVWRGGLKELENDDWRSDSGEAAMLTRMKTLGAGDLDGQGRDAALFYKAAPGGATVLINGSRDGSAEAIALAEIYEDRGSVGDDTVRLVNLSTRGVVGEGEKTMIGGFVVAGGPARLLVRILGPSLTAAGVPDVVAKPRLRVFRGGELLADSNTGAYAQPLARAAARKAGQQVGASLLPDQTDEVEMLLDADAGAFSVHGLPKEGAAGIGIIEIFLVEP